MPVTLKIFQIDFWLNLTFSDEIIPFWKAHFGPKVSASIWVESKMNKFNQNEAPENYDDALTD